MNETRPDSKVTLEDLLRLKRAERPDAAFWTQFEQDFRAKQLAAAVERKRWWFSLPRVMPRLVRFSLPVGATAVLALTFVTVRESGSVHVAPEGEVDATPVAPTFTRVAETDSVTVSETLSEPQVPTSTVMVASTETLSPVADQPAMEVAVAPSSSLARRVDETGALTPSARLIAANMAGAELEFAKVLHRRGADLRVTEEPLAQIAVPSAPRSSRVLPPPMAQLASYSLENERSAQVTERQARRLSEDQFYDAARRLSAQADRLMLKL